ncbi:hypothetical protein QE357_002267 [Siphonobacter sp. BAB-5404]|nr:hypothetical protein [Siphonobacter sp. SORGH_AS_0500]
MNQKDSHSSILCKKPLLSGFLLGLLCMSTSWAQRIRDCAFSPVYQQQVLKVKNATISRQIFEDSIRHYIQNKKNRGGRTAEKIIRIPVVVHVIHNNPDSLTIGGRGNANISVEQIESQIRVLNEDYRRKEGTNGYNTNAVGADMEIEFYLANRDPNGNATTGIIRRYRNKSIYSIDTDLETVSATSYWPSDRYLNIWVLPDIYSYLGYGQFPASTSVPGLSSYFQDYAHTDGIFVAHQYFGSTGDLADQSYALGRTVTHEVGHWLGLIHTWGDEYCGTDYCDDTPPTESSNNTRFCNDRYSNCVSGQTTRNMIENYLDYSPDACMNVFTQDQKNRVRAVLELSPRRKQLVNANNSLEETSTLQLKVYSNPIQNKILYFDATFQGLHSVKYQLTNTQGHTLFHSEANNQPSSSYSIPVGQLTPGTYILTFATESEKASHRIAVP